MQRHQRQLSHPAFLGLLLCVSCKVILTQKAYLPYSCALRSHKLQAARMERGGTGTGGESSLTVFHFHKHAHFPRVAKYVQVKV